MLHKTSEYVYSSASNYINGDGILNIEKVDNLIVDVLKKSSFDNYNSY